MKLLPKTARFMQLSMLGLSIVFAVGLWLELNRDYTLVSETPSSSSGDNSLDRNQRNESSPLPPIDEFASIIERPLFSDDRRPYTPDDVVIEDEQPEQPVTEPQSQDELLLSGIVLSDDKQIALIQKGNEPKIYRLRTGENINGWSIEEIQEKSISLSRGGETKNLELLVKKSPPVDGLQSRADRRRALRARRNITTRTPEETQEARIEQDEAKPELTQNQENIRQPPTPEQIELMRQNRRVLRNSDQ